MKTYTDGILICLFLCVFTINELYAYQSEPLVLKGVHVLTMESEEIVEDQALVIRDGRIDWMGSSADVDVPEGATIHEGDYYVMPGLSEMHAHIPPENQGWDMMRGTLVMYLSQGITTIRGMLGQPAHLELREQAATGEIVSPRIFTSGPSFSGGSVDDPEEARQRVRQQAEDGYDLLKFHPGLTLEQFEAITDEANRVGIEFSGHISLEAGLIRSLEAGKGTIDHLDRYMEFLAGDAAEREDPPIIMFGYDLVPHVDVNRIEEAASLTKEAGVWNVPTNTLLENVFNPELSVSQMSQWPGMEYMPEPTVRNWSNFVNNFRQRDDYDPDQARRFLELRKQLTYALHKEGAGLMLGADAPQIFNPPGYSAHRELELLIEAGLSPFEALETGTVNVARYLGEEESAGKLLPGFRADLILLDSNPLEAIPFHENISGVISDGMYFSRADFDEMMEEFRAIIEDQE